MKVQILYFCFMEKEFHLWVVKNSVSIAKSTRTFHWQYKDMHTLRADKGTSEIIIELQNSNQF